MITFKQYLVKLKEEVKGRHGEYVGDVAEKTMIHAIINILMKGDKTDENYDKAYSFIEHKDQEGFYDRFYDAFAEKAASNEARRKGTPDPGVSKASKQKLGDFKNQLKQAYNRWKKHAGQ